MANLGTSTYDVCIILGGGTRDSKPSIHTFSRILKGVELVKKKICTFLMLTGSKDELQAMYNIAIEKGITPEKIIVCQPSRTTIGNAYYAKKKAIQHGLRKIVVVTSDFHMIRALRIFEIVFGDSYTITGEGSTEEVEVEILEREEKLKSLLPLLRLLRKGDHEQIMQVARFLGVEE